MVPPLLLVHELMMVTVPTLVMFVSISKIQPPVVTINLDWTLTVKHLMIVQEGQSV